MPRNELKFEIIQSADAIARAAWQRLCPPDHPFLNPDFFSILERHGTAGQKWGWLARHLVAWDDSGEVAGILPIYLKTNSYGDFIPDWSWASAHHQVGLQYYPRLLSGIPHTPATGQRFLVDPTPAGNEVRAALIEEIKRLTGAHKLSSWHVGFPAAEEIEALAGAGLVISHDIQFHWTDAGYGDFDHYLDSFTSERRRKVRAERKRVAESGLTLEVRHGDDVDPAEWPALHALYAATFDKFDNHAVFTAAGFAELAAALGRRMVLFIARDGSGPAALSLCFRDDEALYGRYWGTRVEVDSLHFELCFYQGISYCLREGLQRFEPGAGGEHKISRGFRPTQVRSAHWIVDESLREMISQHLERQKAMVAAYCDEAASHLPFKRSVG